MRSILGAEEVWFWVVRSFICVLSRDVDIDLPDTAAQTETGNARSISALSDVNAYVRTLAALAV